MKKIYVLWDGLRSSLWFLPSLLVAGGVVLAIGLIEAEAYVGREQLTTRWPRLFGAGAEGARGMLEAIAGSVITVAGVAFSITVVVFTLASSQYTSRILRNFMRDRANQLVLGVFLGVFSYCLVVLRTIRGGEEGVFVPSVAVLGAVLLAFVAIGSLVFFIHHIAASIQASNIIHGVSQETVRAIDRLFPEEEEDSGGPTTSTMDGAVGEWTTVPASTTGYIQAIEVPVLERMANELDTVIRMERGIGEFVIEATPLAFLADKTADADFIRRLNQACTLGRYRTVHQDAAFGIRQLVDIALKALSPGINDTTTAIICIDFLGSIFVPLASRRLGRSSGSSRQDRRVILPEPTFAGLLAEAFDQILRNAEGNVAILTRLLQIMEIIAAQTRSLARRHDLMDQALLVMEAAERSVPSARDRAIIKAAMDRLVQVQHTRTPRLSASGAP